LVQSTTAFNSTNSKVLNGSAVIQGSASSTTVTAREKWQIIDEVSDIWTTISEGSETWTEIPEGSEVWELVA